MTRPPSRPVAIVQPDQRGHRPAQLWSSALELLVAALTLPATAVYCFSPATLAATPIGGAVPRPVVYAWLIVLVLGQVTTLAGVLSSRARVREIGTAVLACAVLAYAAFLTPERGGAVSLSTGLFYAIGLYLVLRAGRWGRA